MSRRSILGLVVALLAALAPLAATPPAVAGDRDCGDFPSQRAAQIFFLQHGGPRSDPHGLDSDGDGIACESNPAPYYYGTTLPGGGNDPHPQPTVVRSKVDLALDPDKRIAGESFRIKVSVEPAISRKVLVQRKVDGRWKVFGRWMTNRAGRAAGDFQAPKADTHYRAVVQPLTKGGKKYSAATSRERTIEIQRQRIILTFDDRNLSEGEEVQALVRATPIRAGRSVDLTIRTGVTSWETVATGDLNRRGRVTFVITPDLGRSTYRAVVLPHRGADSALSDIESLTVTDVTAPPAPYDLVAVPGDGSVELSWSRELTLDFDHHEVWMRTAVTAWSLVATTTSQNAEITQLANDVTYWFAVTSVDASDNESAMSNEVSATPTAISPRVKVGRWQ